MKNHLKSPVVRSISGIAVAAVVLSCSSPETSTGEIVATGAGSYTTTLPDGFKPLPERIFKTADVKGPTVTGQWWSSLLWQEFSSNMFAHPLGMVCTPQGLAISYPGSGLVGSKDAIMGGGVTPDGDFRIELSAGSPFKAAECGGYSDWFVTAAFSAGDASLKTSFGHGSPFVYCTYAGGDPVLRCAMPPRVWSGTAKDAVLGVTIRGNHYGLFGPTGSTWSGLESEVLTNWLPENPTSPWRCCRTTSRRRSPCSSATPTTMSPTPGWTIRCCPAR